MTRRRRGRPPTGRKRRWGDRRCLRRVRLALGHTTLASRTLRVAHGTTIRASLTLSKTARRRITGGWHTVMLTIPWLSSPRRLSVR
jgi:hypothetical protein